jgi:hypothetical protein
MSHGFGGSRPCLRSNGGTRGMSDYIERLLVMKFAGSIIDKTGLLCQHWRRAWIFVNELFLFFFLHLISMDPLQGQQFDWLANIIP